MKARRNVREREGCSLDDVIVLRKTGELLGSTPPPVVSAEVRDWLAKKGLDGVIWTGLSSNWRSKRNVEFSIDDALAYLGSLTPPRLEAAKKYVVEAPEQIDTPLRRELVRTLGWAAKSSPNA